MRIGICADHGGFALKEKLITLLREAGYEVVDYGAHAFDAGDDFPDFVIPLAVGISDGEVTRGIAVCGSGVGACIVGNKIDHVRAAVVHDIFSAHQGVEDDDMNLMCLGARVVGHGLAAELTQAFLGARFTGEERFRRRLAKIEALEVYGAPEEASE